MGLRMKMNEAGMNRVETPEGFGEPPQVVKSCYPLRRLKCPRTGRNAQDHHKSFVPAPQDLSLGHAFPQVPALPLSLPRPIV